MVKELWGMTVYCYNYLYMHVFFVSITVIHMMAKGNEVDPFRWKSILSSERLNDVCTNLDIVKLAIKLDQWERFATCLGLSEDKVTEIQRSNLGYYNQKEKFLIEWKKQLGSGASYYKLFECFELFERMDLIEVLIPLCLNKENHTGRSDLIRWHTIIPYLYSMLYISVW